MVKLWALKSPIGARLWTQTHRRLSPSNYQNEFGCPFYPDKMAWAFSLLVSVPIGMTNVEMMAEAYALGQRMGALSAGKPSYFL